MHNYSFSKDLSNCEQFEFKPYIVETAFDYYNFAYRNYGKLDISACLSALAIEIAFKSFLAKPIENIGKVNELYTGYRGHELYTLLCQIPSGIADFIVEEKDRDLLRLYNDYFLKGRYVYEQKDDCTPHYKKHYEFIKLAGKIITSVLYLYREKGCDDAFITNLNIDVFYTSTLMTPMHK
ncbi:hypothetical protein ACET7L_07455 [Aeromonas veronii]